MLGSGELNMEYLQPTHTAQVIKTVAQDRQARSSQLLDAGVPPRSDIAGTGMAARLHQCYSTDSNSSLKNSSSHTHM